MSKLQNFLADSTIKAVDDLVKSYLNLPADKRQWVPMGEARSAADQVAECALISTSTIDVINTKQFPKDYDMAAYMQAKSELAKDEEKMLVLVKENTAKTAEAIRNVKDEDLDIVIKMVWGDYTLADVLAYPYWNASYHQGQINYIASMLGCLH